MGKSTTRLLPFAFACATVASLSAPSGLAQSEAAQSASPAPLGLEEIVVTARKREEQLQTTPLSISAFSGASLEQRNIDTLTDLGNVVPNLSITPGVTYPGGLEVSIRGAVEQDPVSSNDSPIALYIDGVYLARQNGLPLDFVDIQRVEVLRGPQGTLFGRNTTGGAISIVTKAPAAEFGVLQKVDYASNNEVTTRTVIDTGEIGGSGLTAKLSYQHHQMDGYVRNTLTSNPGQWPGADDSDSVYFVLHGGIGDALSFDYRFDYTFDSLVLPNYQITVAQPDAIAYYGQSPNYGGNAFQVSPNRLGALALYPYQPRSSMENLGHSFTLDYSVNDALNFKSITAYRSMMSNGDGSLSGQGRLYGFVLDPVTFAPAGIQPVTPYSLDCTGTSQDSCYNITQYQYSEELQASGSFDRFKYVGGVYYFEEHVGEIDPQSYTFLVGPSAGLNLGVINHFVGRSTSYAGYGQVSYTPPILDDRLELTGGFRFSRDEKAFYILTPPTFESHRYSGPSGDFTAKYQWTPDLMTYFRFANSYKAGGFNARTPAPAYQPEYATNYEVGVKSEWFDKRVSLNADIFYTPYTNQQITTTVPVGGGEVSSITVNLGQSTYLGGELEATVRPADGWLVNVSVGYTDAEMQRYPYVLNGVVTNVAGVAKFPYFSKASLNTGAQYTFDPMPVGTLSLRLDFAYKSGEVFAANPYQSPLIDTVASDALKDLSGNVTLAHIPLGFGDTELDASVYGRNLLNQAWRVEGIDFTAFAPGGFGVDAYNRPRVIGFNVTAKY